PDHAQRTYDVSMVTALVIRLRVCRKILLSSTIKDLNLSISLGLEFEETIYSLFLYTVCNVL
ncbi:MAG: hypothetical protein ACXU97_13600, partial [Thermodesulfobacteriota bacterium]